MEETGIMNSINNQLTEAVNQVSIFNLILITLAVGVVIWLLRQVLSDKVEGTKLWRVILRVLPVTLGGLVALIPGVRPVDNMVQSIFLGMIGGSFAQGAYGFLREVAPDKLKAFMGSRVRREKIANGDE